MTGIIRFKGVILGGYIGTMEKKVETTLIGSSGFRL